MSVKIYVDGREVLLTSPQDIAAFEAARPTPTLVQAKAAADTRITTDRNAALSSLTAVWDGDTWDANEETSNRIANALSMIREAESQNMSVPTSINWRTADNRSRALTIPQLTSMGAAVFGAQQMVWARNALLKDAILAATTVAEVESIVW
jgi:hypothetical protein